MTTQEMSARVRAEYLEMPGMTLTVQEVERLCGIEQAFGKAVLEALVGAKFLCVKSNGSYARLTDGEVPRPRPAKADLEATKRIVTAA